MPIKSEISLFTEYLSTKKKNWDIYLSTNILESPFSVGIVRTMIRFNICFQRLKLTTSPLSPPFYIPPPSPFPLYLSLSLMRSQGPSYCLWTVIIRSSCLYSSSTFFEEQSDSLSPLKTLSNHRSLNRFTATSWHLFCKGCTRLHHRNTSGGKRISAKL